MTLIPIIRNKHRTDMYNKYWTPIQVQYTSIFDNGIFWDFFVPELQLGLKKLKKCIQF